MTSSGRFIPAAWLIASLTLGSRVLGLARECVFSYYFSTSELLSAFRIAFMLPNLARRLFGEGALASALVPVLTQTLQDRGERAGRRFVGALFTAATLVLCLLLVLVEGVIALWRHIQDDLALQLAAVLMPYMFLICVVALAGAVLNVRRHFATPAAAPIILNVALITAMLGGNVLGRLTGLSLMHAACVGVLIAGVLQLALSGLVLWVMRFFPVFNVEWRAPELRSVTAMMGPMVLGLSAVQINSLADYLIAYLFIFENGERVGPAVLGYAQYLYQLPLGVFGIAIGTAIFPVLSLKAAQGARGEMAEVFAQGIRLSLFIALPASVGLLFVAQPLVTALFQRGAFDAADTQRVAGTLFYYSVGLAAYFAQQVVVRTFYALHDSRTPARVSLAMVAVNFLMNLSLVFVMQERGLALATASCALIQVVWLSVRLAARLPELRWGPIAGGIAKMVAATAVMAVALALCRVAISSPIWSVDSVWVTLGILLLVGVVVYALTAWITGIKELETFTHRPAP